MAERGPNVSIAISEPAMMMGQGMARLRAALVMAMSLFPLAF
jgi:hypothetical protein